jgi:hypothetical protein
MGHMSLKKLQGPVPAVAKEGKMTWCQEPAGGGEFARIRGSRTANDSQDKNLSHGQDWCDYTRSASEWSEYLMM